MITIIDYKAGNLKSVANALDKIGVKYLITQKAKDILKAEKIIFPGVGAGGTAMKNLKQLKLIDPIKKYIQSNRPFLGICLGAQILLAYSQEDDVKCLNVIQGRTKKFDKQKLIVPHIGWNQVEIAKKNKLFQGIKNNSFFYFVHSYYLDPVDKNVIIGITQYGQKFPAAINQKNLYAVQFHPEKSADNGLKILNNFYKTI